MEAPERLHREHRGSDGGFALALAAAALVPIAAMVALAVDLAVWQGRAAELQRVADAAALAAADAPTPAGSVAVARDVARRNGVVHGTAGIDVAVAVLGPAHARVVVTDPSVRRGFSRAFVGPMRIARHATAERVRDVAMGSPRNFLGTGDLAGRTSAYTGLPGIDPVHAEDFWLSVNGPCASREQGDWLLPLSVANFISGNPPQGERIWRGCTPSADARILPSPSHDPSGYVVGLSVPNDYRGGAFTVQVYDAARCADSPVDFGAGFDPFWTRMEVTDPGPAGGRPIATEVFRTGTRCADAPVMPAGYACGANGTWKGRWCNLATIDNPVPGTTYHVRITTGPQGPTLRHELNSFAVRVRPGPAVATGGFRPCTTDPTDGAANYLPASCIGVHAVGWLSIFAAGTRPSPQFFLAEVGPEYGGSMMDVSLFDIGEGTVAVQVLDPRGSAAGFAWEVVNEGGQTAPTGGWRGTVPPGGALDVRGNTIGNPCGGGNLQPGPGRNSDSKYNDRMVRLRIQLPVDMRAAYGDRRWWRVRYRTCAGGVVQDRTTWGVSVAGQPLRLVR